MADNKEELEHKHELRKKAMMKARNFWHMMGPGLTTGAADDDPSGIATYSQAGARYGFGFLWLAIFTFPLMAVVQEMCARIGMVTGVGLAKNMRHHLPKALIYICALLLFAANSFNIGADLGAMAKATQLLLPNISFVALVILFTAGSLLLEIFTTYQRYAQYLKWLAFILLAYVATFFIVHFNWHELARATFLPSITFSRDQIFLITAVLGTTISPYLFFWQTSQEVEEQIKEGKRTVKERKGATPAEIESMRVDVWTGMFVSNLVMYCIIAVCAAVLFTHGITDITTASDAAAALKPLAGEWASLIFTLGIVGTGLLALPVLAGSASYALSESFGWKEGLFLKFRQAHAFYTVIIVSMLAGLAMNFVGLDPIKALVYSAVANGVLAPLVLVIIMLISGNKKIMKDSVNKPLSSALGWIITGLMAVASIATIISLFI